MSNHDEYLKNATEHRRIMVENEQGEALGLLDLDVIDKQAAEFAFALAAACENRADVTDVVEATLNRVGLESFGYVAAGALRFMTENLLAPMLGVLDAHGTDVRPGLQAFARGETPKGMAGLHVIRDKGGDDD